MIDTCSLPLKLPCLGILCILAILGIRGSTLRAQTTQAQPPAQVEMPGAGGVTGSGPVFRVVRSVSGVSGTEKDGKFVMDRPQTVFHLGQDQKVIAYFEWDGPIGPHKFEGLWKRPDGGVVVISDFQYTATGVPFAGYWTMLLSGAEQTGVWTIDARIDGEDAGSLTFELVNTAGAEAPPQPPPVPVREPLSPDALYKQALASTVFVDKLDTNGNAFARGSGFFLSDGRLITAFENLDGASQIRVTLSDGGFANTSQVLAWNRWQDWAILGVQGLKVPGLPRSKDDSWPVGTVGYYLEVSSGAGRVIADASVVGNTTYPNAGARLNIAALPDQAAVGGPVFDPYGDVIGMMGGTIIPGTTLIESFDLTQSVTAVTGVGSLRYGMAVPITLFNSSAAGTAPTTLDQLIASGQMIAPLAAPDDVVFGSLTTSITQGAKGIAFPDDMADHFSHANSQLFVFISWSTKIKFKGVASAAIYDADNHLVTTLARAKLDIRNTVAVTNSWQLELALIPAGIYRADVSLGNELVWRRFFRITE